MLLATVAIGSMLLRYGDFLFLKITAVLDFHKFEILTTDTMLNANVTDAMLSIVWMEYFILLCTQPHQRPLQDKQVVKEL